MKNSDHLLSHKDRQIRIEQKKAVILNWLKIEGFTHHSIIQSLLGINRIQAHRTLVHLEREGFISKKNINLGFGKPMPVWKPTPKGVLIAECDNDDDTQNDNTFHFRPTQISARSLQHALDLQQAHAQAIAKGTILKWINCKRMDRKKYKKIPDAIAFNKNGSVMAIELERIIKAKQRYRKIIALYLQMIKSNEIKKVCYICPEKGNAERLKKLFQNIEDVEVSGKKYKLEKHHYDFFRFYDLGEWKGI